MRLIPSMKEDPERGYIYAIAPYGNPRKRGWFPVLCLGEWDHALYYAELDGEIDGSDPETWLAQWIDGGELLPAAGYEAGTDGPFDTSGHAREDNAHRTCWLWPWSDQLRAMRLASIPSAPGEEGTTQ